MVLRWEKWLYLFIGNSVVSIPFNIFLTWFVWIVKQGLLIPHKEVHLDGQGLGIQLEVILRNLQKVLLFL